MCSNNYQPTAPRVPGILARASFIYDDLTQFVVRLSNEDNDELVDLLPRLNDLQESFREIMIAIARSIPTGEDVLSKL